MFGDLVGLDFLGDVGSAGASGGFDWGGLLGGFGDFFTGAGNKAMDFGSNAWDGAMQNPWAAFGALGQGAGFVNSLVNQPPQMPEMGPQAQMSQPGGPSAQQMRRRVGDAQNQGLSGASPDFLATMAGVTPDELNQMLGWGGGQR